MKLLKRVERAEKAAAAESAQRSTRGSVGLLWHTTDGPVLSPEDCGPGQWVAVDVCHLEDCGGATMGVLRYRLTEDANDVGEVWGPGPSGEAWGRIIGYVVERRGALVRYELY